LDYIEVIPLFTLSHDIYMKMKWKSIFEVNSVNIQPSPVLGPTNIANFSVLVLLERNGNIIYNISITQRRCSQEVTAIFCLDCPLLLNPPVAKFTIYTNGTMTALTNDSQVITCVSEVWPILDVMCKLDSL